MAWDNIQSSTDQVSNTEWNDMVTFIKSAITSASTVDAATFKIDGVEVTVSAAQLNSVSTKIANVIEDTTPQLGGDLSWNSNALILEGQSITPVTAGHIIMFNGTNWIDANATAESTCNKMLGVLIAGSTVLTHGVYTTSGLSSGAIYYVSTSSGIMTSTAPSASTNIVRIIGYALSTTEFFFDPDKTYLEIA
jgi:hypothetical protein